MAQLSQQATLVLVPCDQSIIPVCTTGQAGTVKNTKPKRKVALFKVQKNY